MIQKKINRSLHLGVRFLRDEQQSDGSFLCLASQLIDDYGNAEISPSIVACNIVLSSLISLDATREVSRLKHSVVNFLLGERGPYWSYNYWFRASTQYTSIPYPDDLDDTFCALSALYRYNPDIFDGEVMARIATILTSAEQKESGPYNMWLVPPGGRDVWNNLDLVVNSNIAYFLSLQGIELEGLDAFIDQSIQDKNYSFPYCYDYPGIYFISRFYKGSRKKEIIEYVMSRRDAFGVWLNPLQTALAVSALLRLSDGLLARELTLSINYLLETQVDGSWPAYSFFFELKTSQKTLYTGSASITTAICLEAINQYRHAIEIPQSFDLTTVHQDVQRDLLRTQIIQAALSGFDDLDDVFATRARDFLSKMIATPNGDDIILNPYVCSQSLRHQKILIPDTVLISLGVASIYGWMAYTVIDDVLDGSGDIQNVSMALVCLRKSNSLYQRVINPNRDFYLIVQKIFNIIDTANDWEVSHCRNFETLDPLLFGDFSKLGERSLGHALGSIGILVLQGYAHDSVEIDLVQQFFMYYLIARQLDDDMHDWQQDYLDGRMTWVVLQLLQQVESNKRSVEVLRHVFWKTTVVVVSEKILDFCSQARSTRNALGDFVDASFFEHAIVQVETSAQRALKEQREVGQFLSIYNQ